MNKIKVTTNEKTNVMQVSQQEYNKKRIPTLIKPLAVSVSVRVFNSTTSESFTIYDCDIETAKPLLITTLSKEFKPTESGNKVHIEIRQSKRVDGKRVFKTKTFYIYSESVLEVVSKIKNSIK